MYPGEHMDSKKTRAYEHYPDPEGVLLQLMPVAQQRLCRGPASCAASDNAPAGGDG
jgi:hypothetical protein